jgi:hypothetical protein
MFHETALPCCGIQKSQSFRRGVGVLSTFLRWLWYVIGFNSLVAIMMIKPNQDQYIPRTEVPSSRHASSEPKLESSLGESLKRWSRLSERPRLLLLVR